MDSSALELLREKKAPREAIKFSLRHRIKKGEIDAYLSFSPIAWKE